MAEILSKISPKHKGVLCIISSAFCFAFMGAFVRLAGDLPSVQKELFQKSCRFHICGGDTDKAERLFLPQKKATSAHC